MENYKRIITEIRATVFEEGMENSYLVYETEYPEDGHYGIPKDNFLPDKHTKLASAIYSRGKYQEIYAGDFIEEQDEERIVWKKSVFERTFAIHSNSH